MIKYETVFRRKDNASKFLSITKYVFSGEDTYIVSDDEDLSRAFKLKGSDIENYIMQNLANSLNVDDYEKVRIKITWEVL